MLNFSRLNNEQKGLGFTFASVALLSLTPVLHKLGLMNIKPLHAAVLWCLFSGMLSLIHIEFKELKIPKESLLKLFTMSTCSSLGVALLFYAINHLDPSTVAFANRSYILFIFLLGIFILKEPTTKLERYFFGLNFIGLLLFSYRGISYEKYHAILFVILSAFLFAYANMEAKVILKKFTPCLINAYSHLISVIILLPLAILFEESAFQMSFDIVYILLGAVTGGYLGMICLYKGLANYPFTFAGSIRAFSPFLTTLYALPFFQITYSATNLLGILLLIVTSICLLNKVPSKIEKWFNQSEER